MLSPIQPWHYLKYSKRGKWPCLWIDLLWASSGGRDEGSQNHKEHCEYGKVNLQGEMLLLLCAIHNEGSSQDGHSRGASSEGYYRLVTTICSTLAAISCWKIPCPQWCTGMCLEEIQTQDLNWYTGLIICESPAYLKLWQREALSRGSDCDAVWLSPRRMKTFVDSVSAA